jgi:hypothetical protein
MSQQESRAKPSEQSELLFDETTASRPRWTDLSHETQRSVTELFARMLRQFRQEKARSVANEVEYE